MYTAVFIILLEAGDEISKFNFLKFRYVSRIKLTLMRKF